MNRRRLFKTLGAAMVVAPMALVVGSEPAKAAPTEAERLRALEDAFWESPEGRAEVMMRAQDLMGERYQAGLRAGLAGAIEQHFSIMEMAYVTTASAEGTYAARFDEVRRV